eukprot:scaffold8110_cov37-Prasinocladus_malaysianus.AAC.1
MFLRDAGLLSLPSLQVRLRQADLHAAGFARLSDPELAGVPMRPATANRLFVARGQGRPRAAQGSVDAHSHQRDPAGAQGAGAAGHQDEGAGQGGNRQEILLLAALTGALANAGLGEGQMVAFGNVYFWSMRDQYAFILNEWVTE